MGDLINRSMRVLGEYAAKRLFDARSRSGQRNVEIHINERDLALAMATVAQAAWNAAVEAVQKTREQTERELEEEGI
jgi:hypothetical protein